MGTLRTKTTESGQLIFYLLNFLLGVLFCFPAHSEVDPDDAIFPEIAASGRALAMGNAFIAGVDDSMAAFYNPAGLGTVRWFHAHLSNLMVEWNRNMQEFGAGGNVSNIAENLANLYTIDGMRIIQQKAANRDKMAFSRFQLYPNLTMRYFGLGYVMSQRVGSITGKGDDGKFEYLFRRDHGPVGSLNLSLMGGIFKVGLMTSYLMRLEHKGEQAPSLAYEESNNTTYRGGMLYGVLGTKLTLPYTFLPTFAAKWNNLYHQKMHLRGGIGAPTTPGPTVDLGFSITPQFAKAARVHLELNFKDAAIYYNDVSNTRRLCAGMEIDIARRFFIRGGWGDGYGTGGLGLKTQKLEVDLTSYAVSLKTSQFDDKEDRRFVFGLSYGL